MSADNGYNLYERLVQYYRSLDRLKDIEGLRDFFTEDGVWELYDLDAETPSNRYDPVDEFVANAKHLAPLAQAMRWRHHLTGFTSEFQSSDTANSWAKVMVTVQPDAKVAPAIQETAEVTCDWRKVAEEWKIVRIVIRRDSAGEVTPT